MLRPVLNWRALLKLWNVHFFTCPIFFFRAAANRGYWIRGYGGPPVLYKCRIIWNYIDSSKYTLIISYLFYAGSARDYIVSIGMRTGERWIGEDLEWCHWPSHDGTLAFPCTDFGTPRQTSANIAKLNAKVRTRHFFNRNTHCYS